MLPQLPKFILLMSLPAIAAQALASEKKSDVVTQNYTDELTLDNNNICESRYNSILSVVSQENIPQETEDKYEPMAGISVIKQKFSFASKSLESDSKVEILMDESDFVDKQKIVGKPLINKTLSPFIADDVPMEILLQDKKKFRSVVAESLRSFEADRKYVGSLQEIGPLADPLQAPSGVEAVALLDSNLSSYLTDKTYSVVDGEIVLVKTSDFKMDQSALKKLDIPAGWVIKTFDSSTNSVASRKPDYSLLIANSGVSAMRDIEGHASAKQNSEVQTVNIRNNTQQASAFSSPISASANLDESKTKISIRGKLLLPKDVNPARVNIRVAGTFWQFKADADGFFEISDLPKGSKFDLLFWDEDNVLVRRLVSVSATRENKEFVWSLDKVSFVSELAQSFGVNQDVTKGGFCAKLKVTNLESLVGAKVNFRNSGVVTGPFYYGSRNLPDLTRTEMSTDGRFCAFNSVSEIVDLDVVLLNGVRRAFSIHLEPTTFANDIDLNLDRALYRPVNALELVDTLAAIDVSGTELKLKYNDLGSKNWISGITMPVWSKVSDFSFYGDLAYSPEVIMEETENQIRYFAQGDEFVELSWSMIQDHTPSGFQLVSRDLIESQLTQTQRIKKNTLAIAQDSHSPYTLKVMDIDLMKEMLRVVPEAQHAGDRGAAFVSIQMAALGLDSQDLRLSLRDSWTGNVVSRFRNLPYSPEIQNSRYLRGFFSDLPEGQYSLVITDKNGSLKWLDVVRARKGSFQVLSIGE